MAHMEFGGKQKCVKELKNIFKNIENNVIIWEFISYN